MHSGLAEFGEAQNLDLLVEIKQSPKTHKPIFFGEFLHGSPAERFIYLSWKREAQSEYPWAWRIKIPLSGISQELINAAKQSGMCNTANVIGRRPHSSEPINWTLSLQSLPTSHHPHFLPQPAT
jgi:hypothetical protein